MSEIVSVLEKQIEEVIDEEKQLVKVQNELEFNPQFKQFLELQKQVNQKSSEVWQYVEEKMIENDVKQIKGNFGTVTLAERLNWITTAELPETFYKKSVDTKRLSDTFRLEGKAPEGAIPSYTKYLMKRLK